LRTDVRARWSCARTRTGSAFVHVRARVAIAHVRTHGIRCASSCTYAPWLGMPQSPPAEEAIVIVSDAVDIGYIVRRHRRHRGMSQSQLCEQADVSRRWLSDFESGKATAEIGLALRVLHA